MTKTSSTTRPILVGVTHTHYETRRPRPTKLGDPDRVIGTVRRQRPSGRDAAIPIVRTARGSLLYPRCPDCGAELRRLVDAPRAVRACRGCGTRFLDSRFLTADRPRVRSLA